MMSSAGFQTTTGPWIAFAAEILDKVALVSHTVENLVLGGAVVPSSGQQVAGGVL